MNRLQQAIYEFIANFTDIDRGNIVKGWQASSVLPPNEDYAVFTVITEIRRGTNMERFNSDNNSMSISTSVGIDVQIDIVSSSNEKARVNAANINTIARSGRGVAFFKEYGVNLYYAEDPKAIQLISNTDNFVNRYMVMLHLEVLNTVTVGQDYFNKAELNRLETIVNE